MEPREIIFFGHDFGEKPVEHFLGELQPGRAPRWCGL